MSKIVRVSLRVSLKWTAQLSLPGLRISRVARRPDFPMHTEALSKRICRAETRWAAGSPAWFSPRSAGLNRASGTMNLSLLMRSNCSPGLSAANGHVSFALKAVHLHENAFLQSASASIEVEPSSKQQASQHEDVHQVRRPT